MTERPLSPHLSVYRFMHTLALSILHRITGVWMALGLCALVYWLASVAAGESEYARASALLGSWYVRVLLLLWLAAYCYHFVNGLRHLAWDAGFGLEKLQVAAHRARGGHRGPDRFPCCWPTFCSARARVSP